MKTTIDIPENDLEGAMRFTKARTKQEAIPTALADFNRRQRVAQLAGTFGSWNIATNVELEAGDLSELDRGKPRPRK